MEWDLREQDGPLVIAMPIDSVDEHRHITHGPAANLASVRICVVGGVYRFTWEAQVHHSLRPVLEHGPVTTATIKHGDLVIHPPAENVGWLMMACDLALEGRPGPGSDLSDPATPMSQPTGSITITAHTLPVRGIPSGRPGFQDGLAHTLRRMSRAQLLLVGAVALLGIYVAGYRHGASSRGGLATESSRVWAPGGAVRIES